MTDDKPAHQPLSNIRPMGSRHMFEVNDEGWYMVNFAERRKDRDWWILRPLPEEEDPCQNDES